jgi:hypothetical protein
VKDAVIVKYAANCGGEVRAGVFQSQPNSQHHDASNLGIIVSYFVGIGFRNI